MAKIYITQFDHDRLVEQLDKKKPHDTYDKALQAELEVADIVAAVDIPGDVITMNSRVLLSDEAGNDIDYQLVFPEDADIENNKISILSPVGCALLGYKVGDTISLMTPNNSQRTLVVKQVLSQPEREGNFEI